MKKSLGLILTLSVCMVFGALAGNIFTVRADETVKAGETAVNEAAADSAEAARNFELIFGGKSIGTFETPEAALERIQSETAEGTYKIKLLNDYAASGTVVFAAGPSKPVIFDTNGKTITAAKNTRLFIVKAGSVLTVSGSGTLLGNGTVQSGGKDGYAAAGAAVLVDGAAEIAAGGTDGAAESAEANADGTAGGSAAGGARVIVDGPVITGFSAASHGNAICSVNGGIIEIKSGSITANKGAGLKGGGAVAVEAGGRLFVEGGSIENNETTNNGGAILVMSGDSDATVFVVGGKISGNKASGKGGAIMNSGVLGISGSVLISGNSAQTGGGIYSSSEMTMTSGNITENTAATGGGVYLSYTGSLTLGGNINISGNMKKSGNAASNLYLSYGKTVTFSNTVPLADGASVGVTMQIIAEPAVLSGEFLCDADAADDSAQLDDSAPLDNSAQPGDSAADAIASVFTDDAGTKTVFAVKSDGENSMHLIFSKKHSIIFNMQGYGEAPEQQTVYTGAAICEPEEPVCAGMAFCGWYKEASCINSWDFETGTVSGDTTLYAKWKKVPEASEFTYTVENAKASVTGSGTANSAAKANTYIAGKYVSIKTAKGISGMGAVTVKYYKDGVQLDGAPSEAGEYTFRIDVAEGTKYAAATDVSAPDWNFNIDASELSVPVATVSTKTAAQGNVTQSQAAEKKTEEQAAAGGEALLNGFIKMGVKNADVETAEPETFEVSFEMNGHGLAVETQTVPAGGKADRPSDPTAENCRFLGWYKDPAFTAEWDFENDEVTKDTVIYAKWAVGSIKVPAENSGIRVDTAAMQQILEKYLAKTTAQTVEVSLIDTADSVPEDERRLITEKTGWKTVRYYDMALLLSEDGGTPVDIGDENDIPVTVTYGFDFSGKSGMQTVRVHNGLAEELTDICNDDGESVIYDKENGTITVTAKKYSSFGLAYEKGVNLFRDDGSLPPMCIFMIAGFAAICFAGILLRRRDEE